MEQNEKIEKLEKEISDIKNTLAKKNLELISAKKEIVKKNLKEYDGKCFRYKDDIKNCYIKIQKAIELNEYNVLECLGVTLQICNDSDTSNIFITKGLIYLPVIKVEQITEEMFNRVKNQFLDNL